VTLKADWLRSRRSRSFRSTIDSDHSSEHSPKILFPCLISGRWEISGSFIGSHRVWSSRSVWLGFRINVVTSCTRATPWVWVRRSWDASERTRERLVAIVRTPRRHIHVRASRKQRPPVCFASNHERFRTFRTRHGFQFPRIAFFREDFLDLLSCPLFWEVRSSLGDSSSEEVEPSSSYSATIKEIYRVVSFWWPSGNGFHLVSVILRRLYYLFLFW